MVTMASGLVLIPTLTQRNVTVQMHFEPSIGISARKLDKLGLDIRSFREPLRRSVKEVMIPSIRMNFDSGGRPPWEGLAGKTIYRKGGSTKILVTTGALQRVATQLNIWTIDSEKALISNLPQSVWYGKVHQAGYGGGTQQKKVRIKNVATGQWDEFTESGAESGTGAIPARPFIVMQNEDIMAIERVFSDWLGEKIAAAGLGGSGV
jgi:phage gpG-like protein